MSHYFPNIYTLPTSTTTIPNTYSNYNAVDDIIPRDSNTSQIGNRIYYSASSFSSGIAYLGTLLGTSDNSITTVLSALDGYVPSELWALMEDSGVFNTTTIAYNAGPTASQPSAYGFYFERFSITEGTTFSKWYGLFGYRSTTYGITELSIESKNVIFTTIIDKYSTAIRYYFYGYDDNYIYIGSLVDLYSSGYADYGVPKYYEEAVEEKTITLYTSSLGNATVSQSGSITMTSDVTITVTPDDGYLLTDCGIWDVNGEYGTYIFSGTVASDGASGTITIPYDSVEDGLALYVWTDTNYASKSYTLECTTSNVSLSTSGGTVTSDVTVTVTANSGYEFEGSATGWLGPSDSDVWSEATYINSSTLQFTIPYSYMYNGVALYCEVTEPVAVTYSIALYSYDGSSGFLPTTIESTGSEDYSGSVAVFVNGTQLSSSQLASITGSTQLIIEGFTSVESLEYVIRTSIQLTGAPSIIVLDSSYNENEITAVESTSGNYYLYTMSVPISYATYYSSTHVYGFTVGPGNDAEYNSDANKVVITLSASGENAELSISTATTTGADVTFNVIPYSGYYFADTDTCVATWGSYSVNGYTNSSGYMVITLPYDQLTSGDVITVSWTVTATSTDDGDDDDDSNGSSSNYSMFTVYRPTSDNITTISDAIFINSDGDYSVLNYFIKYSKFYVVIPIAGTTVLKANGVSFGVEAPYVDTYKVSYDLGTLEVAESLNNAFDYEPYVETEIYLPMIGIEKLDTADIMGKSVNLKYVVDVIGGNCLARLFSEGVLVNEWTGKIATQLPLESGGYNDGVLDAMSGAMLGSLVPYLKFKRHAVDADNLSEFEGYKSNSVKTVGDCSGYVKFDEIWVDGTLATQQERDSIKQLLTNGIIV